MFTYEIFELLGQSVIKRSDNATIPLDPANSDYAEYLRLQAWLAEGKKEADFWKQAN